MDFTQLFSPAPAQPAPATTQPAPAPAQPAPAQQQAPAPSTQLPSGGANPMQNAPNAVPQSQQQQVDPNAPPAQPAPVAEPAPANPLDFFKGLNDNSPQEPDKDNQAPAFSLDPKTVQTAASSIDFLSGVDQEVMAKLQSGDMTALPDLLQAVGRSAYGQALQHGAALTEQHVVNYGSYQQKQMPTVVREHLTTNALDSTSVAGGVQLDMSNPIVAEQVANTAKMLATKNPTATPAQIAEEAKMYHIKMASSMLGMNPEALATLPDQFKAQQQEQAAQVTDWDEWVK